MPAEVKNLTQIPNDDDNGGMLNSERHASNEAREFQVSDRRRQAAQLPAQGRRRSRSPGHVGTVPLTPRSQTGSPPKPAKSCLGPQGDFPGQTLTTFFLSPKQKKN
jgi:hypothetical protein